MIAPACNRLDPYLPDARDDLGEIFFDPFFVFGFQVLQDIPSVVTVAAQTLLAADLRLAPNGLGGKLMGRDQSKRVDNRLPNFVRSRDQGKDQCFRVDGWPE